MSSWIGNPGRWGHIGMKQKNPPVRKEGNEKDEQLKWKPELSHTGMFWWVSCFLFMINWAANLNLALGSEEEIIKFAPGIFLLTKLHLFSFLCLCLFIYIIDRPSMERGRVPSVPMEEVPQTDLFSGPARKITCFFFLLSC